MRNWIILKIVIVLLAFNIIGCGGSGSSAKPDSNSGISSVSSNESSSSVSSSASSSPLQLSLYPKHEDTSVLISLDLNTIHSNYAELGVSITKENSQPYSPLSGLNASWRQVIAKLEPKISERVVTGLKPGTTYEMCLGGLKTNFLTTGDFNCETITTAAVQDEYALLAINYDVEPDAIALLEDWKAAVVKQHPGLKFTSISIDKDASASSVKARLKNEYAAYNLKYVIFLGYDLPSFPIYDPSVDEQYLAPYDKLSSVDARDWVNYQEGFSGEVILAVIKPRASTIATYLQRLLGYYRGETQYNDGVFIADAMKSDEKTIDKNFFYDQGESVTLVEGISDYFDAPQARLWQTDYVSKLNAGAYQFLFLAAHGSNLIHYPCADNCIDYTFIEAAKPKAQFVVAVSCSIGQVMKNNAPMASYVFESHSLSALGAEVSYWDVNGNTVKSIYNALKSNNATIGDAGRPFGFLVFGDPFLRINLSN